MGTTGQSITLANSIIGVGILAMPFCFQQCGILLATLILLVMGLISRLCCHFLLKSALIARRRNFEFLAFHVFGPAGKMAVEVGIIGFLMGTCIAYFVVVGDLGPQIIAKMFNINQSDILRTSIMVVVSLVCVLPLGLLRNVDSLSNVSAATIGFYICLVIKVVWEAAAQLAAGAGAARLWRAAGLLQCVPIFSMALFCQAQLFEIFESLPTLSLEKMNVVTKNAINICTGVYLTLGVFGYIAFSSQEISGNILMSLSPTMGSDVIKLGFVMSLAFSFPLIIFPCRASLYSFLYKKVHSSQHDHIINHSIPATTFRCITVAIIAVALFVSLLIPNIELVLGLVGSTIGVLICLVFPAACFINVTYKNTNERVLAKGVIVLGLIIMVLGTYANLQAAENQEDRYDNKFITQERIDKIVEDFFDKQDKSDVHLKPAAVQNDPLPLENLKVNDPIQDNGLDKDSEIQPPNPVPPESNEKIQENNISEPKADEMKLIVIPAAVDKVPEPHPKDLRTKLEAKLANGATLINKDAVEKPKEVKPKSNEVKIGVKQQKLMETIKQHGEEQKVILDEIIKTQKELQQNKKEADSNEAKKIAVESIKEIANIAIQKLGGVTEKTNELKDEKKSERLEKLKNEAVQEIAKKAFETIEAIQDIQKPEAPAPKTDDAVKAIVPKADDQAKAEIPKVEANNIPNVPVQNVQTNQIAQQVPVNPQVVQVLNKPEPANSNIDTQQKFADNVIQQKKPDAKPVANVNAQAFNSVAQNNVIEILQEAPKKAQDTDIEVKPHSHSPDEPQSYKLGEDAQAKIPPDTIVQNVRPAIVNEIASNLNKVAPKDVKPNTVENYINKVQNNRAMNIQSNANPAPVRQKREAIDCTQKVTMRSEDKKICNALFGKREIDSQEYLASQVDMNSVALPKDLPLHANILHLSRSLKSYDKDER